MATLTVIVGYCGSALVLSTLHRAVECIHLDLSTGEVITLPMRAVAMANATPKGAGLGADFGPGLGAGRTKHQGQSPMISPARPAGLEPATRGLEGQHDRVQEGAPECRFEDSSENKAVQSAGGCTRGADSDARTKRGDVSALRIEEAMKALAAGDVETARRLLN